MNKRFLSLVVLSFLAVGSAWGMGVELPDNHEQPKDELEIITNPSEGFEDLLDKQNHEKGLVTNNDSLRRQEQCKNFLGEVIPDELSSRLQRSPARTSSKKKDDRVPNQEGGHADLLQEFKNNQSKQISSENYTENDTGSMREYSDELVESTDTMKINLGQTTWPSQTVKKGKQEQLETPNDESNPNKRDTLEDIIRDAKDKKVLPSFERTSGPKNRKKPSRGKPAAQKLKPVTSGSKKKAANQPTAPQVSLPQESEIQSNKTKEENVPLFDQKEQLGQGSLVKLHETDISSSVETEGSLVISSSTSPEHPDQRSELREVQLNQEPLVKLHETVIASPVKTEDSLVISSSTSPEHPNQRSELREVQLNQEPLVKLHETDISSSVETEGSPFISRAASPEHSDQPPVLVGNQAESELREVSLNQGPLVELVETDIVSPVKTENLPDLLPSISPDLSNQVKPDSSSSNSESNTHNSDPNAQKTTIQSGKESTLKSANFLDVLRANKWEICAGASVAAAVVVGSLWRINQYLSFKDEQNLNQDFLTQLAERVGDYDDEKISKNELLTFFDTHCGELMLINDQDKATLRNLIVAQKSMELYEMIQSLLPTVKKSAALKTQKMGVMERIQMGVKRDCNTIKHWFGGLYAKIKRIVA